MEHYSCLFLDATWKDMLTAFWYTTQEGDRVKIIQELEALFGRSLACFSVRSGLDLFLSVIQFPKGSEILMTAINIPDMVCILEHHGLSVVPIDIDLETLCPRYEDIKRLITPRTVAIISAHIYGRWIKMDDIITVAKESGLFVLEDCAESFSGLSSQGHDQSHLTFFSFGAIKYATAMGGAIVKVRNAELLNKMRSRLQTYPMFSGGDYVERLFRYSIVMFIINNPLVTKIFINSMHVAGIDYKEKIVSLLRGCSGDIIKKVRHQPSTSMLRFMLYKLQQFDDQEHAKAKINGNFVRDSLFRDIFIPGCNADRINYWLFPILVDNPAEWVKDLEKEKIAAYNGVTQLDLVKPKLHPHHPNNEHIETNAGPSSDDIQSSRENSDSEFGCINHKKTDLYPHKAKFLIDHVLYLPVHKRIPLKDLAYLCQAVLKVAQRRHSNVSTPNEFFFTEFKNLAKL